MQCYSDNKNSCLASAQSTHSDNSCVNCSLLQSLESNEPSLILISKPFIHCLQQTQEFNACMIFCTPYGLLNCCQIFSFTSKNKQKLYYFFHADDTCVLVSAYFEYNLHGLKTSNNCEYLTNNKNVDLNDKSYFKIFGKIINLSRSKPSLLSISLFLSFIDEISYLKQISTLNIFIAS